MVAGALEDPPAPSGRRIRTSTVRRWWTAAAVALLNTVVVLAAANGMALAILAWRRPSAPPGPAAPAFIAAALERAFPDLDAAARAQLVRESGQTFAYEPFTQFRERASHGRFVNVEEGGYRRSADQGPWPPDRAFVNVFLFGGSTTFNYGVRDEDTIASHLQRLLANRPRPARVYNFGRGAYYSSQELVLFERLLTAGFTPDIAIFVDGLNDFFFHDDRPALTTSLEAIVTARGRPPETPWRDAVLALPVSRLLAREGWLTAPGPMAPPAVVPPGPGKSDVEVVDAVIARYVKNVRLADAAARAFGLRAAFVWQPVPLYKYDLAHHVWHGDFGGHERSRVGYPRMAAYVRDHPLAATFIWCADIQEGVDDLLYVDQVHYSPVMSERVARCIAEGLDRSGSLDRSPLR